MRVTTRRARGTLRTFRAVLERTATEPVAAELKWLAGELGVDRDQEVLAERLTSALDALPPHLVHGPVHDRLATWARARHRSTHGHVTAVLDSRRYLTLLDTLDALLTDPPLRRAAAGKPEKVLDKAERADVAKLARLVEQATARPPGEERDLALHEARKKAKRTRYAAEAATPALGDPADALAHAAKALTTLLGDHQDGVMARRTLRELAAVAHAAGESTFTYGVLYGGEEARAAAAEADLPAAWERIRSGAYG
jgi:CHAD domain-containing protein